MRLVRFGGGRTGLLEGDTVCDCGLDPGASWVPVIDGRQELRPAGEIPLAEVALEAPLADPCARIFAMGGNFPMHVTEMTQRMQLPPSLTDPDAPPWGYYVIPGTIVGTGATVGPPPGTRFFDYEAEAAVVLGPDGASAWGYTAFSDFSIRDPAFKLSLTDHGPLTWSLQKNFATGNACGPYLVVSDDVADLRITLRVNGETRQDDTTAAMRFGLQAITDHIREYLPLGAGDMIVLGTPGGTAMEYGPDSDRWLRDGDVVEVEAGEAGVLRNVVRMS